MITELLVALAIGIVLFEIVEHLLFPLIWLMVARRKKPLCGVESMVDSVVEVKSWREREGKVFVNGEIWNAESNTPFSPGDRAVVQDVKALTLKLRPLDKE